MSISLPAKRRDLTSIKTSPIHRLLLIYQKHLPQRHSHSLQRPHCCANMHRSLFSLASALTLSSHLAVAAGHAADLGLRDIVAPLDRRLVCLGDTFNRIFTEVGMGDPNDDVQADITSFCRSWIDIPDSTAFVTTVTPVT